jgi:hypothetical protein
VDLDVALREIERYSMPEKRSGDAEDAKTASEAAFPPSKRPKFGGQNLLQIFMGRVEKENAKNQVGTEEILATRPVL